MSSKSVKQMSTDSGILQSFDAFVCFLCGESLNNFMHLRMFWKYFLFMLSHTALDVRLR